jgi:type IV secretion system protein VirD4
MPALLNYTSRFTPMQKGFLSLLALVLASLLFGMVPTQWFAWKYHYDARLGPTLFSIGQVGIYQPLQWVAWGWKYADVPSLRTTVHNLFMLAAGAEIMAMFFAGYVSVRLSRIKRGMDGLHGTAHFAELDDVDRTGFIDAKGYASKGVVVGSVMLDRKGKVIHPNHPQFARRQMPMYEPRTFKNRFRKVVKRNSEGEPMFKLRKSVVKKTMLLRDGGNTHLFGFCPTRSGKGVGMVVPTLLTWQHSVMVNDPKGEAWALTAGFRQAAGQDVLKFEPACTDGTGARWNPLDEIRIFTLHDVADAQMIMSMACDPKGEGLDDYFDKAGYEFLTAVALHVRYATTDGSLAGAANYLGDPGWDSDKQMYSDMMNAAHDPEGKMGWTDSLGKPTKTHPMIANAAATMLKKEDKDRSGVLSTAKSLLSLYLDPIVANNTRTSDFLVRDLMTGDKPVSLYYVVPSNEMERMTPLTRLFYAIFIRRNAAEMEFEGGRTKKSYSHELLMIIDEASSLKKLPILQEALGYVAGYGIRMFFLVQDIVQVEELYGDKQSFDSGAKTRIAYAPNKIETAEKLARMTGKTTVTEDSGNMSRDVFGVKPGSVSVGINKTGRDLVTADEFMALNDQDAVIFVKGKPPIYGRKAFFYENPVLLKRASMPAPARSTKLKSATSEAHDKAKAAAAASKAAPVPAAPQEPTAQDKWAASRIEMRERIAAATASAKPAPTAQPVDEKGSKPGGPATGTPAVQPDAGAAPSQVPATPPRSRYADKVRTLEPEDLQRIEQLVAAAGVVDKVIKVSAF